MRAFRRTLLVLPFALPLIGLSPRLAPWDSSWQRTLAPSEAEASVSLLLSLDELVGASRMVVVGTPISRDSKWEVIGGGKRIVTYTKVKVDRAVVGEAPAEVVVRTLGGRVGKIGQYVSGEADMTTGAPSLLFLAGDGAAFHVTAMAQGHYPVVRDEQGVSRLRQSPDAGALLPRRGPQISAQEALVGTKLEDGAAAIVRARQARGAK
jgi:hypothetical protein